MRKQGKIRGRVWWFGWHTNHGKNLNPNNHSTERVLFARIGRFNWHVTWSFNRRFQ